MTVGGVGLPSMHNNISPAFAGGEHGAAAAEDVATHFEAVFMSTMLKEMRATLSDGLFGEEASDTLGALFDLHMGQHLADAGGVGLKEMVVAEYAKRSQTQL